jgi:hypothetical protein
MVEGVVAAIESSLVTVPGTSVTPNAAVRIRGRSGTRQVDVVIKIPTGDREMRIGVEVKDHAVPLDVEDIEQLGAKLAKLELDRGCVVAAAFTAEAKLEAVRCGLELRPLAEVGTPEWWLAPAMEMIHQEIETLGIELVYGTEEFYPALQGLAPERASIVVPGQPSLPIHDFVTQQGISASYRPELASLRDEDVFGLDIQMLCPGGSYIQTPTGNAPMPGWVRASYKLHKRIEAVPIRAYQMSPVITALSGVSEFTGHQITFIGHDRDDGSRRVSLSVADASPKRTRISESRSQDQVSPPEERGHEPKL